MSITPFHTAMQETFEPIFGESDKTSLDAARGVEFGQQVLIRLSEYDAAHERLSRIEQSLIDLIHRLADPKYLALAKSRAWFEETYLPKLEAEARLMLDKQKGKKKSVDLLIGKIGFHAQPDKWEWPEDETELIEWCRKNCPMAIKVKESVSHTELKHYFEATGDLPPGCTVHTVEDKFYAKPIAPDVARLA